MELKDIIHLYTGQETTQGKLISIDINTDEYTTLKNSEYYTFKLSQIKLILKPVSELTVKQMVQIRKIQDEHFSKPLVELYGAITIYYCKQGFDIFGLIENNHALIKL